MDVHLSKTWYYTYIYIYIYICIYIIIYICNIQVLTNPHIFLSPKRTVLWGRSWSRPDATWSASDSSSQLISELMPVSRKETNLAWFDETVTAGFGTWKWCGKKQFHHSPLVYHFLIMISYKKKPKIEDIPWCTVPHFLTPIFGPIQHWQRSKPAISSALGIHGFSHSAVSLWFLPSGNQTWPGKYPNFEVPNHIFLWFPNHIFLLKTPYFYGFLNTFITCVPLKVPGSLRGPPCGESTSQVLGIVAALNFERE